MALPPDLLDTTVWVHLNMNVAPVSKDFIYPWLHSSISEILVESHPDIDFEDLDTIQKVFSVEVRKFNKGIGRLLDMDSAGYRLKLFDLISSLQSDLTLSSKAFARYTCGDRGKLLVVVLDNCDKRVRDEQLLMFEAAQWLKNEFKCLVILPIREDTYDNHRTEPPLDTALKDLSFRIESPPFQQVLKERVKLALSDMQSVSSERTMTYDLPNDMRVTFPASELAFYLLSIIRSLFEHDNFARRVLVGLAGKDIRRAMEIFLEFCRSGHITEDIIFRITSSEGGFVIPFDVLSRVILRLDKRFYNDDSSYVKNVFDLDPSDSKPSHFTRYAILKWLHDRLDVEGPNKTRGYHRVNSLKADLISLGFADEMIDRDLLFLLKHGCIISEHLSLEHLDEDDLMRLGPSGSIHLELASNLTYLSSIAEDTWIANQSMADEIARMISERDIQYHRYTRWDIAGMMADYLEEQATSPLPPPATYLNLTGLKGVTDPREVVGEARRHLEKWAAEDPWYSVETSYRVGETVAGVVEGVTPFGLFVELEPGVRGLVYASRIPPTHRDLKPGDRVSVRIFRIDRYQRRVSLDIVEPSSAKTKTSGTIPKPTS